MQARRDHPQELLAGGGLPPDQVADPLDGDREDERLADGLRPDRRRTAEEGGLAEDLPGAEQPHDHLAPRRRDGREPHRALEDQGQAADVVALPGEDVAVGEPAGRPVPDRIEPNPHGPTLAPPTDTALTCAWRAPARSGYAAATDRRRERWPSEDATC